MSHLIPITFHKILQSQSYTVIVLGTEEEEFSLYVEPQVGKDLQIYLGQAEKERPSTHHLMEQILKGLDAKPLQVVIEDVKDSVFFAKLFVEKRSESEHLILEIDARSSDCLLLAVLMNIPLFCHPQVIKKCNAK